MMQTRSIAIPLPAAMPRALQFALKACGFAALTWLGAFVRIPLPFTPVPLTLQTGVVIWSALAHKPSSLADLDQAFHLEVDLAPPPGGYASVEPLQALPWALGAAQSWRGDATLQEVRARDPAHYGVIFPHPFLGAFQNLE